MIGDTVMKKTLEKAVQKMVPVTMWVLMLLIALLMTGCSKITQENYGKIKIGMEYAEVVAVLGEPASCSSVFNATNCMWGNTTRSIDISLVADKVVFLSSKGL